MKKIEWRGPLSIKDIYNFQLGIHMYKLKLSNSIPILDHSYNTRFINNAVPSFQRLTRCMKSLTYNGPKCWNNIPINIRNSPSISSFKHKFKDHLIKLYSDAN